MRIALSNKPFRRVERRRGFTLIEAVLAVAIFAIGVLALGHCVQNCLMGNMTIAAEARARRALENEMVLIEAGAKPLSESNTEDLKGMFEGMTLKTTRVPIKGEKDEKGNEIQGIYEINLEVSWKDDAGTFSRRLTFLIHPRLR